MNGVVPSPVVAEKALRLLEQNRVQRVHEHGVSMISVYGDTGTYQVLASTQGVRCACIPGADLDPVSCSHKVAAQIVWAER